MAIRAIVFDLFDTLVDLVSENIPAEQHGRHKLPPSVRALYEAVAELSKSSFEDFTQALGEGAHSFAASHFAQEREVSTDERFRDLAERLAIRDPELPGRLTAIHMRLLRDQVVFPPHHEALLRGLRRGTKLGLCSNFSHARTALEVLETGGFLPHLDAVVISETHGLRKPRREIFDDVLARLGVAPEEALHVGDSLRADVGGAAPCGIRTVWITRRVRDPRAALAAHEGPRPDHVVEDLAQLPELVARLSGA